MTTAAALHARLDKILAWHPIELGKLRAVLADGVDVRVPFQRNGSTELPLHAAGRCLECGLKASKMLVEAGADIHANDLHTGRQALHAATLHQHADLVRWLLEQGASPDGAGAGSDSTPLMLSTESPQSGISERLLQAGADPNLLGRGGLSPLASAVKSHAASTETLVQRLLAAGADPNQPVHARGRPTTALALALPRDNAAVVQALLAGGAALEQRDAEGRTPLHQAVLLHVYGWAEHRPRADGLQRQSDRARVLLQHGAAVDPVDDAGQTPLLSLLSMVAHPTPIASIDLLLAHGADPSAQTADGRPALHLALHKGEPDTVHRLLAAGARLTETDRQGQTAEALRQDLTPLRPPSVAFVDALARGHRWARGEQTLGMTGGTGYEWRYGVSGTWTVQTVREHAAWILMHDPAGTEALAQWLADTAADPSQPPRSPDALRADLLQREPEMADRVRLELRSTHAYAILEAALRGGKALIEASHEGSTSLRFVPDAPAERAFRFDSTGEGGYEHTEETDLAGALRWFRAVTLVWGRLAGSDFRRKQLDDALTALGFETERQWLRAQRQDQARKTAPAE